MNIEKQLTPTYSLEYLINYLCIELEKKYYLLDEESSYFKTTFLFVFFKLREENDLLDLQAIIFDYESIKEVLNIVQILFKKNFKGHHISHAFLISKIRELFYMKKNQKDLEIQINNLQLDIEKEIKNQYIRHILKTFKAKDIIPYELFIILKLDIERAEKENKIHFEKASSVVKKHLLLKLITSQINCVGKNILIQNGELKFLIEPPHKKDLLFNLSLNSFDPLDSLKLLTSYFGDEAWHKLFMGYNIDNSDFYFCFNKEPFMKISINNRKYKSIVIKKENFNQKFLDIWESRLFKNEKQFFLETFKKDFLKEKKELIYKYLDFKEINLKKILNGLFETSSFEIKDKSSLSFVKLISSISSSDSEICLTLNKL